MDMSLQSIGDLAISGNVGAQVNSYNALLNSNGNTAAAGMTSVDKAAQSFESMFFGQLLQPMFEGLGVDQTFGGGHGEEIMRSFLIDEYGKIAAQSGKLGISAAVKTEMLRAQEVAREQISKEQVAKEQIATQKSSTSHTPRGAKNRSDENQSDVEGKIQQRVTALQPRFANLAH